MKDKLTKILSDSLSDEGIEEVLALVESTVEDRVKDAVTDLEGRVSGFLKLKMGELKESARKQVAMTQKNSRSAKLWEAVKELVASDLSAEEIQSVADTFEESSAKQQEELAKLNEELTEALQNNSVLESKLSSMKEQLLKSERKATLPFKSSEKAVIITREVVEGGSQEKEAPENEFLTEEVTSLL